MRYYQSICICLIIIFTISIVGFTYHPQSASKNVSYGIKIISEEIYNKSDSEVRTGNSFSNIAINRTISFNISDANLTTIEIFVSLKRTSLSNQTNNTYPENASLEVEAPNDSQVIFSPSNLVFSNGSSNISLGILLCNNPSNLIKDETENDAQFLVSNTCKNGIGEWTLNLLIFQNGSCVGPPYQFEWSIKIIESKYFLQPIHTS